MDYAPNTVLVSLRRNVYLCVTELSMIGCNIYGRMSEK
jgi:hypothetical protein